MTATPCQVILCGYHWAGCKALQLLLDQGHQVYVFTHESPYHIPSLADLCLKLGVPFSLENISSTALPFTPEVICSIYYRNIIKKSVIDACGGRIFNLHPSLLPKYRGCSSLSWAMISGEAQAGFTYHYIDEGCDTGDIIIQERMAIELFDTQETLYLRIMFEGLRRFDQAFQHVRRGLPGCRQEGEASYYHRGSPLNGQIDPAWDPDYKERFVRAFIFPPYPVARMGAREIYSLHDLEATPRSEAT